MRLNKDISKRNRILLGFAILFMVLVYFVPLWSIEMGGRQFPEPLKIYIWVQKLSGGTDKDIYTINDFNHYVGMKKIHTASIPELKYMPFVLAYMIIGGILSLFYKKFFMILLGIFNTIVVGITGLYDFYAWLHDFGTDLDTRAPLYSKDVDFQPPIIACKEILNVTTCSWPYFGSIFLFITMGILCFIAYNELKGDTRETT